MKALGNGQENLEINSDDADPESISDTLDNIVKNNSLNLKVKEETDIGLFFCYIRSCFNALNRLYRHHKLHAEI